MGGHDAGAVRQIERFAGAGHPDVEHADHGVARRAEALVSDVACLAQVREQDHDVGLTALHGMDGADDDLGPLHQRLWSSRHGDIRRELNAILHGAIYSVAPPAEKRTVITLETGE